MSLLGIEKRAEKLRDALYKALLAKAAELHKQSPMTEDGIRNNGQRALVMLDLADVIRTLKIEETPP